MADPEMERDPVEVLADEFIERLRVGEHPSIAEYVERNPEKADEIRELFPAIAALERVTAPREELAAARASLKELGADGFGDFRLVREIGRGGMGIVFEAEQKSLQRRVAVKILPSMVFLDPKQQQRFQREARTAGGLSHKNIVPVYGVGRHEGFHFIVMQLIRGVGLDELVAGYRESEPVAGQNTATQHSGSAAEKRSRLPTVKGLVRELIDGKFREPAETGQTGVKRPSEAFVPTRIMPPDEDTDVDRPGRTALPAVTRPPVSAETWRPERRYCRTVARIGLQAVEALGYAHDQGTLHRDVKPANLLLDSNGTVWITDFGLAKSGEDETLSCTGDLAGTLRYMAPEQFNGRADSRSDIYGLGLTLYELLTLQPAFADADRSNLMWKIADAEPVAPRKLCPQVPRDLETIVLKAIARNPVHRYASAGELAADLRGFLGDKPIRARRANPAERLWRWTRRNPLVASLTSAVASLMTLVIVVVVMNREPQPETGLQPPEPNAPGLPIPDQDREPLGPPHDPLGVHPFDPPDDRPGRQPHDPPHPRPKLKHDPRPPDHHPFGPPPKKRRHPLPKYRPHQPPPKLEPKSEPVEEDDGQ